MPDDVQVAQMGLLLLPNLNGVLSMATEVLALWIMMYYCQ